MTAHGSFALPLHAIIVVCCRLWLRMPVGNRDGIPALKERITVRMTSEMIARIDAWIAHQPGYVSRQDAVRNCVDLILGHMHKAHPS